MVQYNQNANCPISVYNLAPSRVEDLDSQIKKKKDPSRRTWLEGWWNLSWWHHGDGNLNGFYSFKSSHLGLLNQAWYHDMISDFKCFHITFFRKFLSKNPQNFQTKISIYRRCDFLSSVRVLFINKQIVSEWVLSVS